MRLDSPLRDIEHSGDLADRQVDNVPEDDRHPLVLRQEPQQLAQLPSGLVPQDSILDGFPLVHVVTAVSSVLNRIERIRRWFAGLAAPTVPAQVHHDRQEPRAHLQPGDPVRVVAGQGAVGPQEGLSCQVLGVGPSTGDAQGHREDQPPVSLEQLHETGVEVIGQGGRQPLNVVGHLVPETDAVAHAPANPDGPLPVAVVPFPPAFTTRNPSLGATPVSPGSLARGAAVSLAAVTIDSETDLDGLRRTAEVVAEARDAMLAAVTPGVSTGDLDAVGRAVLRRHGARSAPRSVGFPAATCISVNDEAAHGIPSGRRELRAGDLVNIDVSAELDGYWADTGASVPVGQVSPDAARLVEATRLAQQDAMAAARAGSPLSHIGRAVQRRADRHGFSVLSNLCGHGVGGGLHEPPTVPSIENPADRTTLWEGLVLAIEPFLTTGATYAVEGEDGWTLRTPDGSLAAQYEHTVVVTNGHPLVLTASAN